MTRLSPIAIIGVSLLSLLAARCDPPGKPKDEEEPSASSTDFKTLFSENCSGCHGDNGRNGAVRPINDPTYLSLIPRSELQRAIESGRVGTSMPAWLDAHGGPLSPAQVTALVDGIEGNWAKSGFSHPDAPPYSADGRRGDPAEGRKLFTTDCFMCHGKGARIGSVTDPSFLSIASDQSLRTAMLVGRLDLGMPNYQHLNRGSPLTDQNVTDIGAYLSTLRPADAASITGGGTQ